MPSHNSNPGSWDSEPRCWSWPLTAPLCGAKTWLVWVPTFLAKMVQLDVYTNVPSSPSGALTGSLEHQSPRHTWSHLACLPSGLATTPPGSGHEPLSSRGTKGRTHALVRRDSTQTAWPRPGDGSKLDWAKRFFSLKHYYFNWNDNPFNNNAHIIQLDKLSPLLGDKVVKLFWGKVGPISFIFKPALLSAKLKAEFWICFRMSKSA